MAKINRLFAVILFAAASGSAIGAHQELIVSSYQLAGHLPPRAAVWASEDEAELYARENARLRIPPGSDNVRIYTYNCGPDKKTGYSCLARATWDGAPPLPTERIKIYEGDCSDTASNSSGENGYATSPYGGAATANSRKNDSRSKGWASYDDPPNDGGPQSSPDSPMITVNPLPMNSIGGGGQTTIGTPGAQTGRTTGGASSAASLDYSSLCRQSQQACSQVHTNLPRSVFSIVKNFSYIRFPNDWGFTKRRRTHVTPKRPGYFDAVCSSGHYAIFSTTRMGRRFLIKSDAICSWRQID